MNDMTNHAEPSAKRKSWIARHKILTGVGGTLIFLVVLGSLGPDEPADEPTAETSAPAPGSTTPTPEPKPSPTPVLTPQEEAQAAVEDTDADSPEVQLIKPYQGTVTVNFKVREDSDKEAVRHSIAANVFALANAVDESGITYKEIWFEGSYPLVDEYGNESRGKLFIMYFNKGTVKKINFDNPDVATWDGLENLADRFVFLLPDLRT